MKITSVSMNRPMNRAQAAIKKTSAVSSPLTMVAEEISKSAPRSEMNTAELKTLKNKDQNAIDTLGSEVDVWV
jgi:hypothetical protein